MTIAIFFVCFDYVLKLSIVLFASLFCFCVCVANFVLRKIMLDPLLRLKSHTVYSRYSI